MTAAGSLSVIVCPNCRGPMQPQAFERHDDGSVRVDLCFACAGIWFDHLASVTPFFQFLREKQFVRSLNPADLQRVRLQVRQITCSECGAPIDLEHSSECKYCHAPVSFLDSDAVEKAVKLWSAAEDRRLSGPTPAALADAFERLQFNSPGRPAPSSAEGPGTAAGLGVDLVAAGIHAIGHLFDALR